jgi:hypothetical protein
VPERKKPAVDVSSTSCEQDIAWINGPDYPAGAAPFYKKAFQNLEDTGDWEFESAPKRYGTGREELTAIARRASVPGAHRKQMEKCLLAKGIRHNASNAP